MNDSLLLKACETRDNYYLVRKHIKKDLVSKETLNLLNAIGDFYEQHNEINTIRFDDFYVWFTSAHTPDIKLKELELYKLLLTKVVESESVYVHDVIAAYKKKDVIASLQDAIVRNKSLTDIKQILDHADVTTQDNVYVSCNLNDQQSVIDRTNGLKWGISWLNEDLAPLIMGDFGVIAGDVEAGKTSFVISQVVHMAAQLPADKQVCWFVNEGYGRVTLEKIYQSTFSIREDELKSDYAHWMAEYTKKMGRLDKIQVIDAYGFTYRDIESVLRKHNVGLIVVDMLDHVQGFHHLSNQASDKPLEALYQWGREAACKYAPFIATSQIAEGYDAKYPPLDALKGSRKAKQGAASFVMMLGMDSRDGVTRYLGCVKNKLRSHNRRYFKRTISFDVQTVSFI